MKNRKLCVLKAKKRKPIADEEYKFQDPNLWKIHNVRLKNKIK